MWAQVTQVSPVRVQLNGDTSPLPYEPPTAIDAAFLALDDMVMVERVDSLYVIVGRAAGFTLPDASATVKGLAEFATDAETIAGTDDGRAVTPAGLRASNAATPAFYARSVANQTFSGAAHDEKIMFTDEVVDNGGDFNSASSRFTAPIEGLYQIAVSLATSTSTTGPEVDVFVNGSARETNVAIGYAGSFQTFGASVLLDLSVSDYVEMYLTNNNGATVTLSAGRCRFSGFLVT